MKSKTKSKPAPGLGKSRAKAKDAPARSKPKARKKQDMPSLGGGSSKKKKEQKQEIEQLSDTVTKGKNGETNITVEWYWQWVNNSHPCGWKIGTLDGHQLEVEVEIQNYRKQHAGTTQVDTGLVPINLIPIGAKGNVRITDTNTGEKRDVEFGCYLLPGPIGKLWKWLKKMFTNSSK